MKKISLIVCAAFLVAVVGYKLVQSYQPRFTEISNGVITGVHSDVHGKVDWFIKVKVMAEPESVVVAVSGIDVEPKIGQEINLELVVPKYIGRSYYRFGSLGKIED